jgi:predicted nucleic acid-binding protein
MLLEDGEVATHPMVLGELACGNLARRHETLQLLESLPAIPQATDRIVREAIETRRLWGKGIGWIDAHLVLACLISGVHLWTLDRRLARIL